MFTGIRWRLIIYYLVVIAVIVIVLGVFFIWFLNYFYKQNLHENLYNQAVLATSLVEEMLDREASPEDIDAVCKDIGSRLGMRITLVDAEGVVLGDSNEDPGVMDNHRDRPEIIEALQEGLGVANRYSGTLDQEMYYLAIPLAEDYSVDDDPGSVPVLRLALPLTGIQQSVYNLVFIILVALFLSSFFALGAAVMLSQKITGPIGKISSAAHEIAAGNYLPTLKVEGQDELAMLAENITEMGRSLKEKIDQVTWQKNKLETVVSSMSSGTILTDSNLRVEMINPAAERLFDLESREAVGKPLQSLIRYHALHENLKAAVQDGRTRIMELSTYYPYSAVLETYILPVTGSNKEMIGVLLLFHEVTHLRSIEKMRSDFVANVSHEIRTPLTTLRGYTETILHEELSREQLLEFLAIIDREATRLSSLVDDLLDLARIENEKDFVKKEKVALNQLIDEAMGRVEPLREEKGFKIEFKPSTEELYISGNREWLYQALLNILENSIRYGRPNGRINIAIVFDNSSATVEIEDDGPGIPEADLPYVFERFYRVDKARSRKSGGTGLGLSIVKHIFEAHGAFYTLESTEGKGSVFQFTLPLVSKNI